jgi:type I restriction enzyme S subunit
MGKAGVKLFALTELVESVIDNRGRTCPTAEFGIPLIATNCVTNDTLYPVKEKVRFVSEETYKTWFKGHPIPGDVLFVNKGTPGRVNLVPKVVDFCIAQDMVALRPDSNKINPLYFFAALRSETVQQSIKDLSVGSTIPHLKKSDFQQLEIPVVESVLQEYIGNLYFDLSQKIETNKQIALTLERIAHAIFKSWFIDFDPVHAKARGELPVGIDAETAALFPDSFEDSELGPIPAGWEIKSLTDLAEYRNGLALQKYPAKGDGNDLPVLKIPQLKANSVDGAGFASSEVPERFVITDGDCIFSWSGALEVRIWCGGEAALNQHLFKVVPLETPTWNAYFQTLNHLDDFRAIAEGKATTMGHIKRGDLENAKFAGCPDNLIKKAEEVIAPLLSEFVIRGQQNRTLTQLRDSLLPRLISGELEIPAELLEA